MVHLNGVLTVLAAISFAVSGSASAVESPPCDGALSPNPPAENLIPLAPMTREPHLSNGERMRRGLGLNKPVYKKRATATSTSTPSPTPVAPVCTGRAGYIRTHAGSRSEDDPYLSRSMNAFGEYGTTSGRDNALKVVLCGDSGAFSVWAPDAPIADLAFVGGISGAVNTNDNMSPSSYNYAYLGATVQSANGSPAVSGDNSFSRATSHSRNIESSIWSIGEDDALTLSWVNTNGARVNGVLIHVVSGTEDSFVFSAGYSAYIDQFGPSPIWNMSFEEA